MTENLKLKTVSDLDEAAVVEVFRKFSGRSNADVKKLGGDWKSLELLCGERDNFMSIVRQFSVRVSTPKEDEEEEDDYDQIFHVVVKMTSDSPILRAITKVYRPFLKEIFWYSRAQPMLAKAFPTALGHLSPVCYFARCNFQENFAPTFCQKFCCFFCWCMLEESEEGVLFLENLSKPAQGRNEVFTVLDKTKIPSYDHVRLTLEALANLHGAWWQFLNGVKPFPKDLAAKDVDHAFIERMPSFLMKDPFQKRIRSVVALLKLRSDKVSPEVVSKFERFFKTNLDSVLKKAYNNEEYSTISTICHGDLWINNILFSHEKDGVTPKAVKFIDFQQLAKGHPANDLWYFFYFCTDRSFRVKYCDVLLRSYFGTFSKYLGGNLEMSFDQFKKEVEQRRLRGFMLLIVIMPNALTTRCRPMSNVRDLLVLDRLVHEDLTGPLEEQEEEIKMIRERIVDLVLEMNEANCFD